MDTSRSLEVPDSGLDPGLRGGAEGGLKELVLKWFTETQVAGLAPDGHFPDWFQGFATRKEAEEQLKDKSVGVFLVRLSEKAIGYVLSYKGVERCRHFVISQKPEGQFCVTGDELQHNSVSELIQHYKVCPIQPFGEFLTSDNEQEEQEDSEELYDVVNVNIRDKSGLSVKALRSLWDQKGALITEMPPHTKMQLRSNNNYTHNTTEQTPALPPKSTRRLTGSMSVDTTDTTVFSQCTTNDAPSLGFLLTASSPNNRLQNRPLTPNPPSPSSPGTTTSPATYSSLVKPESRSRSLPCLDQNQQPTEPARPPQTLTCLTYSLLNDELSRINPLYHPVGATQGDSPYAEVADRAKKVESTYEDIAEMEKDSRSNTYESIEELKTKKDKCSKGKQKEWKNFFTDYLKK